MLQLVCILIAVAGAAIAQTAIEGRVTDGAGLAVPGARVRAENRTGSAGYTAITGANGDFRIPAAPRGEYAVSVSAGGFGVERISTRVPGPAIAIQLQPRSMAAEVTVRASSILGVPEQLSRIPGSAELVDRETLRLASVMTTEEALRKVSGVHARSEEGFGLRPNIGIRGLNPTRSSRVLLLEDGAPLSYAPYGDNASYYHPPIERFENIEVLKGSGQIVHGPMTVGGVVNYVTPPPPDRRQGEVTLLGGNRDYFNGHLAYGGAVRGTGLLFDAMRKQGDMARDNTSTLLNDVNLKSLSPLGSRQTLSAKVNYYTEESNLTYSGLREDEYRANPRGNPFKNDFFYAERFGASVTHTAVLGAAATLTTQAYGAGFQRDWWRQSSNSGQRPNDPRCGGMVNLHTICGNEGRLRGYRTWGLSPKLRAGLSIAGARHEIDAGFRFHREEQERRQDNGAAPTARTGTIVENNRRTARAASGFLQDRVELGRLSITPGVRVERVAYRRWNRLNGAAGHTALTAVIPGVGAAFQAGGGVSLFAGIHRGFAPPRVEDVINNSTGASVELEPESSWNAEAGARWRPRRAWAMEAAWFRMDFSNQIVPASVAGGLGATLTNGGRTLHSGAEISGRYDWRNAFGSRHGFYLRNAWTWLPEARYESRRFSSVPGSGATSIEGNRLPYAPGHLLNSQLGYNHAGGFHAMVEGVHTGFQYADDLNRRVTTPDGQRGTIPGVVLFNASANYPVEALRATFFLTAKNVTDRTAIVDRSRGILPTIPRLIQAGVRFRF